MKNARFQSKPKAKPDGAKHLCDAGYCREWACVDFGRHVRQTGIPGEVRYLCCKHAPMVHRTFHPEAQ